MKKPLTVFTLVVVALMFSLLPIAAVPVEAWISLDRTPPVTTISLSGVIGLGGWFRSDVTVTLTAIDTQSGVKNIQYNYDGTWHTCAGASTFKLTVEFTISIEGETTIYYRSTDYYNNPQQPLPYGVQTEIVKIDKTAPEGLIMFDAETKDIVVIGVDMLRVDVTKSIEQLKDHKELRTYLLVDDAGNTLELKIEVKKAGKELRAELVMARYGDEKGIEIYSFQKNKLKIEYSEDKKTGDVKDLEQKLKVEKQFTVHAEYNHKKDETKIKIHPYEQKAEKYTIEGMWTLGVTTCRGKIGYIPPT